ncbi:palmitoyltransferase ZDHHC13 [Octopus bimaculoides]|uniref:Palmitoyltransferase n=1 Tax=Octopus bimaculoides TaxID=37653 RepID=A0A0L8G8T2_OCTBM|nr:palmitoyltransferase ZDHHC13 [Octopus bimaculoides]|eukprot:XP_014783178.1 PREDICTED: palmitoyltransferase ZDHHC13-like [Octopus bimaculoides]
MATVSSRMDRHEELVNAKDAVGNTSAEYSMLMHGINTCAAPLVHQIVRQNPQLVHQKGWHSQTPLHKASLGGDWTIIYLLLEAGADPNMCNDFDETPLHYVCRRGIASNVHLMLQHNADIQLTDKQGRSVVHHAAQSGSVCVLHYLNSVHNLSLQAMDNNLQTPLHIVCQMGHLEALKYLTKNQRSDVFQKDVDGNTVLHLTAKEGFSHISWILLNVGDCSLLHMKNKQNMTPLDLVLENPKKKSDHKQLVSLLSYMSSKKSNQKPPSPLFIWWLQLLQPCLVYTSMLVIAHMTGDQYQGAVAIFALLYFLFLLRKHSHRMNHVCKWPNPVYAGMFSAGLLYSIFTYFLILLPNTRDYIFLHCLSPFLTTLLLYLYWKMLRTDPGTIRYSLSKDGTNCPYTLKDLCVPPLKVEIFCEECEIVRSPRVKHCRLCVTCFQNMDHHCLFLLKCVAKNNHTLFVWFLICCAASLSFFLLTALLYCVNVYKDFTVLETVVILIRSNIWILTLSTMDLFSLAWILTLIRFQFIIVSQGNTTYFQKSDSVLTSTEKLLNIAYFLQGKQPFASDPFAA